MILISTTRRDTLTIRNQENNAFLSVRKNFTNPQTGVGTEVQPAANAFTGSTYDRWEATRAGNGNATLQMDEAAGGGADVRFAAIAGHNAGSIGCAVRAEYHDGTDWQSTFAGTANPSDNRPIGFRFDPVTGAQSWRFVFAGIPEGSPNVRCAVAYFGTDVVIDQPGQGFSGSIFQGYAPPINNNVVDLRTNVTEGGNYVASAYVERGRTWEAELTYLDPVQMRGLDNTFRLWNIGTPMFWGWRPDTESTDLIYTWRSQGDPVIDPVYSGPRNFMSFSVGGRAYLVNG